MSLLLVYLHIYFHLNAVTSWLSFRYLKMLKAQPSDGTSEAMSSACSPNRIRLKYLALDGQVWDTSDLRIPLLGQIAWVLLHEMDRENEQNIQILASFINSVTWFHMSRVLQLYIHLKISDLSSQSAWFTSLLPNFGGQFYLFHPPLAGKSPKWITEWPSDIEQKYTHPDIDIHKNMDIYKSSYRYINVCVCVCLCVLGQRISSPLPKPHTLWINLTFFSTHLQPPISWNVGSFWVRFFEPIACSESRQDRGTTIPTLPKTNVWFLRKKQAQVLSTKKPPLK